VGVETGLVVGVGMSLALYLYRTSRPHMAEVGLVAGTEHFRIAAICVELDLRNLKTTACMDVLRCQRGQSSQR